MIRHLYLSRLGEQQGAEHGVPDGPLSSRGRRQANALSKRLADVPLDAIWCSPLERGMRTAEIVAAQHPGVEVQPTPLLIECVPSGPSSETPPAYDPFFGSVTPHEIEAGRAQLADAAAEFLAHGRESRSELLLTHNAVIAWFVREVLGAPEWKWVTLNQGHCGLTVLVQKPGRPWALVSHNDLAHLSPGLRSGLPEGFAL